MLKRTNLNILMKKYVLGEASEEECAELFSRADAQEIEDIMNHDDFLERYEIYSNIDSDAAFHDIQKRLGKRRAMPYWLKYAAVVLALLTVGGVAMWHVHNADKRVIATLPEHAISVTAEMQTTMNRAKEVGKAEATIALLSKTEQAQIVEECGLSTEELLEARKLTTFKDREYWVRLCDGSMVHINGGTRLIYPEHFYGNTRDIYIEGEAYFMVAEDKDHPFVVHTPHGNVKELGTEFNVCTKKMEHGTMVSQTEVVLVKGSIAVSVNGSSNEHLMKPGDCAVMGEDGRIGMGKVDVTPYVAWNTGTFTFLDKSLVDVMNILAKWYGVDVRFVDKELRNKLITGTFDRYESLENILSGISKSMEVDIKLKGGCIVVE